MSLVIRVVCGGVIVGTPDMGRVAKTGHEVNTPNFR